MDNRVYWVHLQQCCSYAVNLEGFIEKYGNAEKFYNAGSDEWKSCGIKGIARKANKNLCELPLSKSEEIVKFCDEHSIHIITPDDKRYPKNLLKIKNFPLALYVRGDADCLNSSMRLAVIGSRNPSIYGESSATKIVQKLAQRGVVIVSGGALGIDSIAHKTAIFNGTKTVLVMGCGHGANYLAENAKLRKAVSRNGALVTEYPPYTPVGKQTFPERNRIISGMSEGVVIIEAAQRSGTLSTANYAVKHNRSIFVLPGDIDSNNFSGSNKLIAEGTAKAVFSAENILSHYGIELSKEKSPDKNDEPFERIHEKAPKEKTKKSTSKAYKVSEEENDKKKIEKNINFDIESVSKNAQIVYNIMSDGVCELDEIKRQSALEVRKVLTALVELEMIQVIQMTAPNRYEIKS